MYDLAKMIFYLNVSVLESCTRKRGGDTVIEDCIWRTRLVNLFDHLLALSDG